MNDETNNAPEPRSNPWKTGVIATAAALTILAVGSLSFAAFNQSEPATTVTAAEGDSSTTAAETRTAVRAAAPPVEAAPIAQPAPAPVTPPPRENCAAYLAGAERDNVRVAKDGAIGAMVGAGTGAAGGAIADGGSGAGKGAGIGAVVGAVAGAAHGFLQESERSDAAERAYRDCLARNG